MRWIPKTDKPWHLMIYRALLGLALSLLLLGCGNQDGASANSDGGLMVLHRGNGAEPDSLDPQKAQGSWEAAIISEMFLGLTTDGPDGETVPGAARSWQTSADGLNWTFKLRPGLVWSDGAPVTADDFVYSLRRILDPKTAAQYAALLYSIKNAQAVNGGKMPTTALGVRAIDAQTFEISLEHPVPYLLQLARHQTMFAVPQHVVEKYGNDWIKPEHIVVDGAYKLAEWVPNSDIKLVKNPRFFDASSVKIDVVYFYPLSDQATELKRYQADEFDITSSIPSRQLQWAKDTFKGQVHMHQVLASGYSYINVTRPPFTDLRVRRALALAIDREAIAYELLKAGQTPAYSLVPPGIANYSDGPQVDFKSESMDERRAEAKRLLAQAGFGPDHPLKFTYRFFDSNDDRRIAIAMQDMWKAIGVDAQVLSAEAKSEYDALRSQNYDVASAGWVADYDDAENFLYLFTSSNGPMNYSKYSNPTFDALMAKADDTVDTAARAKLLQQAEAVLLHDMPIIPETFSSYRHLVKPYVKGWVDNVSNMHRTRYLSIERGAAG